MMRELDELRYRVRAELTPGQARVASALLVEGPEFNPPERPVTFAVIADAFGLPVSTVATHLRRVRQKHPSLWSELDAERQRRLERWRSEARAARRERSRRWGKHRWAVAYRRQHGVWPWLDPRHTGR